MTLLENFDQSYIWISPIRYVVWRAPTENFDHAAYALAQHRGVERTRQIVVLGDGCCGS